MGDARVSKRYKYVTRNFDREGRERWYLRRRYGPSIRLPVGPGSKGFDAAYFNAMRLVAQGWADDAERMPVKPHWKSAGYVYFLRCGDVVKIGFSKEPLVRLTGLKTTLPGPVHTIVTVPGTPYDERRLHRLVAAHRINGEWFGNSPAVMRAMAQAAAYGAVRFEPLPTPPTHTDAETTSSQGVA